MQQHIKIFIIPYLHEAHHVSGDTPPIIRSLKLHWWPLVFHTWKVVEGVEQLSDKINSVTCASSWDLYITKVIFFLKENQQSLHSRTCNVLF